MVSSTEVISLHPLSLLGISDYYTRSNSELITDKAQLLIGGLLGKHNSVLYSFEILVNENGIDQSFLNKRLKQFKTIYPNTELIGFFQISLNLQIDQLAINLISSLSHSLQDFVYMLVSPKEGTQLPIKILTLENLNLELSYKIESAPSEKASLNSINESELKPNTQKPSELFISKTESLNKSLQNLSDKVLKVIDFLSEEDDVIQDELLMEIDKLVFELEYIKSNESSKKEVADQKLELLMAAASNLMILLKPA